MQDVSSNTCLSPSPPLTSSRLISPLILPPGKFLQLPPNSCTMSPFLMSSISHTLGAMEATRRS